MCAQPTIRHSSDPLATAPALGPPTPAPIGAAGEAAQPLGAAQTPGAPQATAGGAGWIVQTALALAAVLVLVLLARAVVARLARYRGSLALAMGPGGRAPSGVLEVLGRYPLVRGQTLVLLKVDRRVLLVAQCAGGRLGGPWIGTLTEITDPDEVASILIKTRDDEGLSASARFEALIQRLGADVADDDVRIVDEVRADDAPTPSLRDRLAHLVGGGA